MSPRGRGRRRSNLKWGGDAGDMTMLGDGENWDDGGDNWSGRGGSGCGSSSEDDDNAPLVEYIG